MHIKQGEKVPIIAQSLGIGVKTVSSHKTRVMRKMGFERNNELYSWLRNGICR